MTIDFHTHTFPDKMAEKTIDLLKANSGTMPFTDGTVNGLSRRAKTAGVDLSVVLPVITNPLSCDKINAVSAEINRETDKTGVLSFGGIHPEAEDYKTVIKNAAALGLKGLKIHPAYQRTPLNDIKYKRIISYAEEYELITVTHGGLDIGVVGDFASPKAAAEIIKDVRPQKFVIAHLGGWEQWEDVEKYLVGEEVYLDTSFTAADFNYSPDFPEEKQKPVIAEDLFLRIIKGHGAEKILFGTDSPWGDQKIQKDIISRLPISDGEKKKILGENAERLLGL